MPSPAEDSTLDRLAELAITMGVRVQPGQDLIITAPTTALSFVRRLAEHAYRAGANLVLPFFTDEDITLARYREAPDPSFDRAPAWLYDGMAKAFAENTARLAVVGEDPMLLSGEDPAKVSRANRALSAAAKPAMEKITGFDVNWHVSACPTIAWARRVFPDLPETDAFECLANAIFSAARLNTPDPIAAWAEHNATLQSRRDWLDSQRFSALHFRAPGTDLTVGLADDHIWQGGAATSKNGITCNPNIPTEEVFTTPHARRVEGTARSTKPLSYQGTLIENIEVRFAEGRIVAARASRGEEVLRQVLDVDEGAARLGEVALVPHSSPISASGLLFFNTLFDENAACHIALGQCYAKCFENGGTLSKDQIIDRGGNQSNIHIDWMIGSGEMDVDGIKPDGGRVPVFRQGEWV